jgi:hypothetical protein
MTVMTQQSVPSSSGDREPAVGEIDDFERGEVFEDPGRLSSDQYPRVRNVSAGHMYKRVPRALAPVLPEYVTVPLAGSRSESTELLVAIASWNLLWEAAQFRRRVFAEDELPARLREVADRDDVNVVFVPRTVGRYYEYAPLFHLLSRSQAERHGLPLLRVGIWPFIAETAPVDRYLPADFEAGLSRAWASAVWRHLMPGSPLRAFSASDPIRLLAHNLDFWLPPVTAAIEEILRGFPVIDGGVPEEPARLEDGTVFDGLVAAGPRAGGDLWCGEAEAAEVVQLTVEHADATGRLRGILEAVRANRVEDDFSDHWSYAREDFERKLYHKRAKIKVRFVELTDTIPVQGPETEVEDDLVFADFLALLDERERQVVLLLRSGMTKVGDVASALGYKNHSPVSKRLTLIRKKAAAYFGDL